MPRSMGDSALHISAIDKLVPVDTPVLEYTEVLLGKVEEGCNGCGKAVGNVDVHGVGGKCEKIKLPEEVPCLVA